MATSLILPEQAISKKMAYGTKNVSIDQRSAGFVPKIGPRRRYGSLPQVTSLMRGDVAIFVLGAAVYWGTEVIDTLNGLTGCCLRLCDCLHTYTA